MAQQRSRGRPPKAVVTPRKIADAALAIVAEAGYGKLTMSAVARNLGVAPSALYNHVSGKEELLYLVEDALMAQVDTRPLAACLRGGTSARAALLEWARSYRDVFSRHTPLIEQIATMPIFGARETVEMYELVVQVLLSAGVAPDRAIDAVVALESFIFGSAYDVRAPADIFAVPEGGASEGVEAPGLREALSRRRGHDSGGGVNPYADPPFEWGLQLLVGGILGA
ncbi:TetR/AcrR family transcriptional regulator [Corynebacterium sp. UBA2622]|uniref:TetR/AcrR family transcriptional regulator n=1 Tax=Corynebacterium sp. UBA2622 TaxID=1946393 RepID=UPI0025C620C8|nr:TetR/AcrR family transcriptional regulator [Corynebacterium sp. UBA2622]